MNAFLLFNYSYLTKQEISSLFFNLSRYNRTHFHININASCNPASSAPAKRGAGIDCLVLHPGYILVCCPDR